ALRLEETRRGDENAGGPRARGRDIQAVRAVEELHAPRRILGRGSGHGDDDDRRLLPLELVDRPDMEARESIGERAYVGVVGSYDEDVLLREQPLHSLFVDETRLAGEKRL